MVRKLPPPKHTDGTRVDGFGSKLPLADIFSAAPQLHQTGHSLQAHHRSPTSGGSAGEADGHLGCAEICRTENHT